MLILPGGKPVEPLGIHTTSGWSRPCRVKAALYLRKLLASLGVPVEIRLQPMETLLADLRRNAFDAYLLGWARLSEDPDYLRTFFHSDEARHGGGGDAVKHGDLDSTLKDPPRTHDVHMGGQDFRCQDCHVTMNHKIAGASTTSAVSEGRVSCVDCHDPEPHPKANPVLDTLNRHCDTVACQTCHIPRFAKAKPTLMFWDWSRAGMEMVSTPSTAT